MVKCLRKIIALGLMGALTTSLMVGCGSNGDGSDSSENVASTTEKGDVVELVYNAWGDADEDAVMKELLAAFEEANPDIKIKYNHIPDDYSNKMNTVLASGAVLYGGLFYPPKVRLNYLDYASLKSDYLI